MTLMNGKPGEIVAVTGDPHLTEPTGRLGSSRWGPDLVRSVPSARLVQPARSVDKPADKPGGNRQKMAENGAFSKAKSAIFPYLEPGFLNISP